ncbi:MAG: hypothetical protein ACLUIQ_08360 [Dialister invisus]
MTPAISLTTAANSSLALTENAYVSVIVTLSFNRHSEWRKKLLESEKTGQ